MHRALVLLLCGFSTTTHADPAAYIVVQHSGLAGFRYYEGSRVWNDMKVGDRITLIRERQNPHDPGAVRVEWRGHMIGYVPRRENGHLARQIDHGVRFTGRIIALDRTRNGRNRVSYEIFVPLHAAPVPGSGGDR
jgi:hypothetical protein